jgi:hypothetical protein
MTWVSVGWLKRVINFQLAEKRKPVARLESAGNAFDSLVVGEKLTPPTIKIDV